MKDNRRRTKATGNRFLERKAIDNKQQKKKVWKCLFWVFLALTIVSGCIVAYDFERAYQERRFWENIRSYRQEGLVSDLEWTPGDILPAYQELYDRNPDMVGWLTIGEGYIDYPVMQTKKDPEYYLRRNFDGEDSSAGTPFVDYRCSLYPRRSFNVILYGHYTDRDQMFRRLLDYAYEQWAMKNKLIRFDTLEEEGTYEVVAAFYYDGANAFLNSPDSNIGDNAYTFYNYIELDSKEGFEQFVEEIKKNNLYQSDVKITPEDELLTIVCCAPESFSGIAKDGRFVLVTKKVNAAAL